MKFGEDFLHYIWQFRLFDHAGLGTSAGDKLEVIYPGVLNKHSGPDFSNAKVKIGTTEWAGNVEIHIRTTDWTAHDHHYDAAYNNVILHVVYEDNGTATTQDGRVPPTLILRERILADSISRYYDLLTGVSYFPCQQQVKHVKPVTIESQLARCVTERLLARSGTIYYKLNQLKGDWNETFHHFLMRNFGFKINAVPFEMLAAALSTTLLARHAYNPIQVEALLFGQAGFLHRSFIDSYPEALRAEYAFLKKKYKLTPLSVTVWKFMRLRPQNFPTLRLAQFAALFCRSPFLFSRILSADAVEELVDIFTGLPVNVYWKTHYHFNRETAFVHTEIGQASIENILINTVAEFLFAYGRHSDQQVMVNKAIALLEYLPREKNAVIKRYLLAGMPVENALHSQAVLQLQRQYCAQKKCLSCGIGVEVLKGG